MEILRLEILHKVDFGRALCVLGVVILNQSAALFRERNGSWAFYAVLFGRPYHHFWGWK